MSILFRTKPGSHEHCEFCRQAAIVAVHIEETPTRLCVAHYARFLEMLCSEANVEILPLAA